MEIGGRVLEPTADEFRRLLSTVVDYLCATVESLPDAPVARSDGIAELLADPRLRQAPQEAGRPLGELLEVIDRAASKGFNPSHPGLLGFVPGGGIVTAGVADLVADVLNRYTGQATPSPGLVAMETDVLRWLSDLFDLPEEAAGILTTGASLAVLSALITARTALLPADFLDGTIYVTAQTHAHVAKAARLLGFPSEAVRLVALDAGLRMDPAALQASITADRAAGRRPFFVVASAGTTNTGRVDPLAAVADIAADKGIWLHVDAAYGGFFQLTERGRKALTGIERADSLALDAHKGMFLPFGTGCLLVRDGRLLRQAHSMGDADYLQDLRGSTLPDFADYGPELTRDFRGLRLWLPLQLHGVAAFREMLDEKLDLARFAHRELSTVPGLILSEPPELSTFCFRLSSEDATAELLRRVNDEGRVYLSSTRIDGQFVIRLCVLNFRTSLSQVSDAIDSLCRHTAGLAAEM
ncbi:aminotransferase class I/II-fold pyridoxal phosphate-dependent enzyme [Kribbella sp. NBC_01505]|uniref:pyridoxal phosphate-dependent decarboxylase family protein n=1 Tax=Kribbella sp. NBC_01505 TaxID=2903580 RepID=UPI00386A0778